MDLKLHGKTALVTGGAKGIGAGISRLLVQEGVNVVVNYRSMPQQADTFVEELNMAGPGRAIAVQTDIGNEEKVDTMFNTAEAAFGPVRLLFNNASALQLENVEIKDMTLEYFHSIVTPSVNGLFLVSTQFIRRLGNLNMGGHIVNVGSKAGVAPSTGGQLAYTAAKAACHGFSHYLAAELAGHGIHVNEVLPGYVMNQDFIRMQEEEPDRFLKMRKTVENRSFYGRFLQPEHLADAAVFLASERGEASIGITLDATGGRMY